MSVIAGRMLEELPGSKPGTVSADLMFDGWFTEEGELFDATTPVLKDITVYSKSHEV